MSVVQIEIGTQSTYFMRGKIIYDTTAKIGK